jgi:preprotein translocase subunit SecF
MELFKQTEIDFLGNRKYFYAISALLIVVGLVSLAAKGGPRFGIDFKGGALAYVKFKESPDTAKIRSAFEADGLPVATLQPFDDSADSHELKIDLDLPADADMIDGRARVAETLRKLYPTESEKLDFNNAGAETLAERLQVSPKLASSAISGEEIRQGAEKIIDFRDQSDAGGLVKDFSEFASVSGLNPDIIAALPSEVYLGAFAIRGVEVVGPKIGKDLQGQAVMATLYALGGMLVYIALRFEWIYGVAAVAAVFHDVLVTIGFFSLFDREIELTVVAALLTLVGYSMNDTIVIFDRVRENLKITRRMEFMDLVNLSVNQTISRTVSTSGLTLITVLCLFMFGGEVLRGFSFALVVGIIVGTYSSIFIASPILLWWRSLVAEKAGARKGRAAARG